MNHFNKLTELVTLMDLIYAIIYGRDRRAILESSALLARPHALYLLGRAYKYM